MSIASKRAKERQNRSSDELVTGETKISRSQNLQVSDIRETLDFRGLGRTDARKRPEIRCFRTVAGVSDVR